jgi:hypothetical protein
VCLLASHVASAAVFLWYSILSSSFFQANNFLYDVFFASVNLYYLVIPYF